MHGMSRLLAWITSDSLTELTENWGSLISIICDGIKLGLLSTIGQTNKRAFDKNT